MEAPTPRRTCPACGNPQTAIIPGQLYRCTVCLLYERITRSFPKAGVTSVEETELPKDPEFENFLKVASQYGAPGSLQQFMSLSEEDRKYYLNAYKIYLQDKLKAVSAKSKLKTKT